jgi:hypothetical protein
VDIAVDVSVDIFDHGVVQKSTDAELWTMETRELEGFTPSRSEMAAASQRVTARPTI